MEEENDFRPSRVENIWNRSTVFKKTKKELLQDITGLIKDSDDLPIRAEVTRDIILVSKSNTLRKRWNNLI